MPQPKRALPEKVERPSRRPESQATFAAGNGRCVVDASGDCDYIRRVPAKKIQVGQVWKHDSTGDSFLVTKMYNEGLSSYAVLRKTGSETDPPVRVKVANSSGAANLPGYTYTQQADDF
jgi:hypothetical protein